tara:strand:+ start:548 stop:5578 length:5031 start_codon:yes stop_codon:yes gene_type:complete
MAENRVNLNNKNLEFLDTDNPNVKFVRPAMGVRAFESTLGEDETPISSERTVKKPEPKYSEKEILSVDDKKQIPGNWRSILDETRFHNDGSYVKPLMSVVPPPTSTPGPCCMGDTYTHKTTNSFNQIYVWNAIAGNGTYATVPQKNGFPYNPPFPIIPTTPNGEFVYGVWDFNVESGNLPPLKPRINIPSLNTDSVQASVWGTSNPQFENNSIAFSMRSAFSTTEWTGNLTDRSLSIGSQSWAFPPYLYGQLTHNGQSQGMQTQIDWGNSLTVFPNMESYYNFEYVYPDLAIEEESAVPDYTYDWIGPGALPKYNPFCQGRALLNPGQPKYPNPWPGKSYASGVGSNPDGKLNNPRRMGWEGWILRPTNVDWNWGNRGAFESILHYTLGPSEVGSGTFIDNWGYGHTRGNILDFRSCSDGYCDYPIPSPLLINNQWVKASSRYFYQGPYIGYSQLEHQSICCSNSQWFQNARVLRNYSEQVWNLIGSPFAGGSPVLRMNEDLINEYDLDLSFMGMDDGFGNPTPGLVGTTGNGPPIGSTSAFQAKFSCSTVYTLNRILQYISSPSDFEEIFAKDFGNYPNGTPIKGKQVSRLWFPVQAGYYNSNAGVSNDEPYENMYRFRDVGKFYTRINLCGQAANESLALGELGNLGNPPIAQIDTTTGEPNSQLNPGIFPWGHCITYACGNPEYSPNYDSGTTSNGSPQITFNKLGERGCEAQTPWAQMPLNYYYSNVTFAGIKVWFYDENTGRMTSKMFRKWSFSNDNRWSGQVPSTYEEASESAIGFMMWLGHNSWDYNITNPTAFPNSTQAGIYGTSVGRPAGFSGGTGIQYWEPVETNGFDTPYTTGHFVADLNYPTVRASTNGYFKGIRPNYTFLDVATHLLKMEEEWPIQVKNPFFDYNNRPTGVPEYNAGVPVSGTYKNSNPKTGIPFTWWNQGPGGNIEPNGFPYFYFNSAYNNSCCDVFPGEGNSNPWDNYTNIYGNQQTLPPPTDASWNGLKDGPGNPGGGNYCTQYFMEGQTEEFLSQSYPGTLGGCANWQFPFFQNKYIDNCFKTGMVGQNYVEMPDHPQGGGNRCFKSGDVRGVFQDRTIGCVCWPWFSLPSIVDYLPQLITGPHCEGCNVGCCTNEFNSVNKCEYVYPQGLFQSKADCARAHAWEWDTIPTSMLPAFIYSQSQQTPFERRKTYTSPLGDITFCKLRPQGNPGCLIPEALNYSPAHTEDCSGSIAWTYTNSYATSVGLQIDIDNSCCEFTKPGYKCDTSSDIDGDGMGDCLQTCTYGNIPNTINVPFGGIMTIYTPSFESDGCYSAQTECDAAGCPYYPTSMPGYSCDYPNSNVGCAQNTIFSLVNPPTQNQLQSGGPYSSLTQCEQYNGGPGSPYCTPQSGWQCKDNGYLQPGLSIMPFDPQEKTDGTANGNNPNNFFRDGCQPINNYYGPPANGIVQSNNWWESGEDLPAGRIYDSKEDCLADCYPCFDPTQNYQNQNQTGSGTQSAARDWCQRVKDELQNQFGNFWTEADINSAQFKDPNPTNLPPSYSPNFDSSWYSKYKNCCTGRICSSLKFSDAEKYALKGGTQTNHDGNCGVWNYPNLGFGFPLYGNTIYWNYDNPGWLCNLASNQDMSGNYAGSQASGGASYEFIPGQGYQPKTTWPLGAGNNGPDGVCEDKAVKGVGGDWDSWTTGVGFKT